MEIGTKLSFTISVFKKFSSSALKSSLSSSECSPKLSTAILKDSSVEEVEN